MSQTGKHGGIATNLKQGGDVERGNTLDSSTDDDLGDIGPSATLDPKLSSAGICAGEQPEPEDSCYGRLPSQGTITLDGMDLSLGIPLAEHARAPKARRRR